jgi:hypothetical protein
MARGQESKQIITKKILETFEGSFLYNQGMYKEIRIPIQENGEIIQIKCVLTAAKINVENAGSPSGDSVVVTPAPSNREDNFITDQEKEDTKALLKRLNL